MEEEQEKKVDIKEELISKRVVAFDRYAKLKRNRILYAFLIMCVLVSSASSAINKWATLAFGLLAICFLIYMSITNQNELNYLNVKYNIEPLKQESPLK